MFLAFSRAAADMFSPTFASILIKSAALSLLLIGLIGIALYAALDGSDILEGGYSARFDYEIAGLIYALTALSVTIIGAWFLFRAVMIAMIGLFADDIIDRIEERHYPDRPSRAPGHGRSLLLAISGLWRLIWVNILCSPLYILLAVTGIGMPIAFLIANGWAFGRDLDDAMRFRRQRPGEPPITIGAAQRLLLGMGATFAATLPVVQIAVPVMAVAMAAHLAHGRKR